MSQSSVAPSEIYAPYAIARQTLQNGALTLERWATAPGALDAPPCSQHVLLFRLNDTNPRHSSRLAGKRYEGAWPKNAFGLVPVGVPIVCSWESPKEALALFIEPAFVKRIALETDLLDPDRVELQPLHPHYDAEIESIAKLLALEIPTGDPGNSPLGSALYLDSLTNVLGVHLLRRYCTFEPKTVADARGLSGSKLRQAIAYIHDNLDREISLGAIATHLGMSPYHFSRWFKQSMGVPPYRYALQQRIERAKVLLQHAKLSLADVALQCGFNSQSHLIHHFKKQTGMTPKQYRELRT